MANVCSNATFTFTQLQMAAIVLRSCSSNWFFRSCSVHKVMSGWGCAIECRLCITSWTTAPNSSSPTSVDKQEATENFLPKVHKLYFQNWLTLQFFELRLQSENVVSVVVGETKRTPRWLHFHPILDIIMIPVPAWWLIQTCKVEYPNSEPGFFHWRLSSCLLILPSICPPHSFKSFHSKKSITAPTFNSPNSSKYKPVNCS